jgi:methionyl-tRNA formyltransferase
MIAVTEWKEEKTKQRNTSSKHPKKVKKEIIGEYVMINPEILEHSTTTQITEEACLSIPNVFGEVQRFQRIKVKRQTPQGKTITKKLNGFNAVVVQHEIDHLSGVLFTDKVLRFTKG